MGGLSPYQTRHRIRSAPFGRAYTGDTLWERLLSDVGWDPFLEDPASLWLLHWQLSSIPLAATTWSLAINLGYMGSFGLRELGQALIERKDSYLTLTRYHNSSVEKDASCFIRMYAPPPGDNAVELTSPRRKPGSRKPHEIWIPAFA